MNIRIFMSDKQALIDEGKRLFSMSDDAKFLRKVTIVNLMLNNAFLEISDASTAQKLSDRVNPEGLHKVLDVFAKRYAPVASNLRLGYTCTIRQIECTTDIMFKQPEDLQPLYDEIVHTAVFTVKPDNTATFPRQRITYSCKKEVGTSYNQRITGTRIKHHMGDVSIKMYDEFGSALRIGSTCNDTGAFRVKRKVDHRDGSSTEQKTPLKRAFTVSTSCLRS